MTKEEWSEDDVQRQAVCQRHCVDPPIICNGSRVRIVEGESVSYGSVEGLLSGDAAMLAAGDDLARLVDVRCRGIVHTFHYFQLPPLLEVPSGREAAGPGIQHDCVSGDSLAVSPGLPLGD